MSDPFIGEIRLFGFGFPPKGWALCNGQQLSVSQNAALFSLLGTQFGGDGRTTFGLPDLRGRTPLHIGAGYSQGNSGGAENVTLTTPQIPLHNHLLMATSENADKSGIGAEKNRSLAQVVAGTAYGSPTANITPLDSQAIVPAGNSVPHSNLQPYQVVSFAIALTGLYPSRP